MTFAGDYETVVTDKEQFLVDCSAQLDPVECIDVRSGSIIITLRGDTDLTETTTRLSDEGLIIPGYPALYAPAALKSQESEDSSGIPSYAIILICVGVVLIIACGIGLFLMSQKKDKKVDEHSFAEPGIKDTTVQPEV